MSFVGSAIKSVVGGIGDVLGLSPKMPDMPMLPPAPTIANSTPDLDAAAQSAAASTSRGRTSTMLTGGAGETEDTKYTSKILLGQ